VVKWLGLLAVGGAALGLLFVACVPELVSKQAATIEYVEVVRLVDNPIVEIREVIVEREVVREVIVEQEVIVERFVSLREFATLVELEEWLEVDTTNALHFVISSTLGLIADTDYDDCDDYALALQLAAEHDGYRLSVQIDVVKQHALNSAFIGNSVYFIEPQTDEIWLEAYRDPQ